MNCDMVRSIVCSLSREIGDHGPVISVTVGERGSVGRNWGREYM